jgi:hypothetical protein
LIVFRDPAGIKLNPSHQCGVLRVERPLTEEAGAGHCGKREGVCGRKPVAIAIALIVPDHQP